MKYFSPSTKRVYIVGIHRNIPVDRIEISNEQHMLLKNKPSPWHTIKDDLSAWELTPDNQILHDAHYTEQLRSGAIKQARKNSKFKERTVAQAYNFINNKLDSASSAAEVKEAIREILIEMVPHIID